jgi:threonine dehydrogenase-like Zn-dependent dehydrogenase
MIALVRARCGMQVQRSDEEARTADWVRVLYAGVCGTDIQIARGERPDAAAILGHEAVGLLNDSQLVVFNPVKPDEPGTVLGHGTNGVFRSRFPVTESWPEMLVPIPDTLPLPIAALCEPAAAVLYGWELVDAVRRISSVGIWGGGAIGLMHCLLAHERGHRVQLFHHDRRRLEWARDALPGVISDGATTGDPNTGPVDAAFLCTGRSGLDSALPAALDALVDGGVLVCVGGVPREFYTPLLPGVDLGAVRRRNVCGGRAGDGTVAATTNGGKRVLVTGHRGTSPRQVLAAHEWLTLREQLMQRIVSHSVDPVEAVALINARCSHSQRDDTGREIVKIVIGFDDDRRSRANAITCRNS